MISENHGDLLQSLAANGSSIGPQLALSPKVSMQAGYLGAAKLGIDHTDWRIQVKQCSLDYVKMSITEYLQILSSLLFSSDNYST